MYICINSCQHFLQKPVIVSQSTTADAIHMYTHKQRMPLLIIEIKCGERNCVHASVVYGGGLSIKTKHASAIYDWHHNMLHSDIRWYIWFDCHIKAKTYDVWLVSVLLFDYW